MRKHGHRRQGLPYSWERLQLILDHLFSPLKLHQHNTNSETVHAEFTSLSNTSREKEKIKLQHVAWIGRTTTWISRHEVPQKRHCKKQRAQRAHSAHTQRLLTFKIAGAQRYDHNRHTSMYQSWCVQRKKKGLFKHKFSYFKLLWLLLFIQSWLT